MTDLTYDEFTEFVAKTFPNDGDIRYGQYWFNALHALRPEIANAIRGTLHDPFFRDIVNEKADGVARTMWADPSAHDVM